MPAPRPAAGTCGMWTCVSTKPGMTHERAAGRWPVCGSAGAASRGRAGRGEATGLVHLDAARPAPSACHPSAERRQQARTQAEGRSVREG